MRYLTFILSVFLSCAHAMTNERVCVNYESTEVCGQPHISQPGQIFYIATVSAISATKAFGLSRKDVGSGQRLCELLVRKLKQNARKINVYANEPNFEELTVGGSSDYLEAVIRKGSRFVRTRVQYACGPTCDASKLVWMLESISCGYEEEVSRDP